MKILLVHNNYGKYSGEEAVVDKKTVIRYIRLKSWGYTLRNVYACLDGAYRKNVDALVYRLMRLPI